MTRPLESKLMNSPRRQPPWRRPGSRVLIAAIGISLALPSAASAASTSGISAASISTAPTNTAVPLVNAADGGTKPGSAAPGLASQAPAPGPALVPAGASGLSESSYTVTLPTGDKVALTRDTSGGYQASALPGTTSRITFSDLGKSAAQADVSAYPDSAMGYVQTHLMDRQAFDVTWLAAHGDTGANARIPLTVHFGGTSSAAALSTAAGKLAGAKVLHADAGTGDVDLSVNAADAGAFWTALTGGTANVAAAAATAHARPAFTSGVTGAWLTDHKTSASAVPTDAPASTVTWTITKKKGEADFCAPFAYLQGIQAATSCPYYPTLVALTGAAAGQEFIPTAYTCLDTNPCTTYSVTFDAPSGVYLAEDMGAQFYSHGLQQIVDEVAPQIVVSGDTAVSTDLDAAAKYSVDAPRSAVDLTHYINTTRPGPDGVYYAIEMPDDSGQDNIWTTPTSPVTIGSFHQSTFWLRGQAPLSAAVTGPSKVTLHPYYPTYSNLNADEPSFQRFAGTTTAQVVNVGTGTAADFAKVDVHGRLVLMRRASGSLWIDAQQMTAALQAGAAGVLIDPRDDDPATLPVVPVKPSWWWTKTAPVQIPFATITPDDAAALTALLGKGPATVSITDHGNSPYFYNLAFNEERQIPATLHFSVDDNRLAQRTTAFHSTKPATMEEFESIVHPDDYFQLTFPSVFAPAPSTVQQYYGPVAPDLIWMRGARLSTDNSVPLVVAHTVFDAPGKGSEDWFAAPRSVGAPSTPANVEQTGLPIGRLGSPTCAFCRLGDTFYPLTYLVDGANPALIDGPYIFAASATHFYQNGVELPAQQPNGIPVYQLSDQPATDRLTVDESNLHSDWTFSSRRPQADGLPQPFGCVGVLLGQSDPCGADPLIQLRYNAFTDAGDAVTADARHRIEITPYSMVDPSKPTAVTSMKVWTSVDGGGTWTERAVSRSSTGAFDVDYRVPALSKTDGAVSVKVQAADAAGDSVTQTLLDTYSLTAG